MGLMPMISAIAGNVIAMAKANSAHISTGAVVIGMISAVVLAVKAGKEAEEDIEEVKEELETDELSFGEIVRTTWKRFIPVVLILTLTISCFLYSTNKMMKRYAALSTAYALTESYMKDYIHTAQEELGPKKEQILRDKVMEKRINNRPMPERGIIETGKGDTLCYESITMTYFHSSVAGLKEAEKELASIYKAEGQITLNEYTNALGIGRYSSVGDYWGWRMTGKFDGTEDFRFEYSYGGHEKTGEPYCCIYFYENLPTDLRLFS